MRRISWVFWYYLIFSLLVLAAFTLGDFSQPTFLNRLILLLVAILALNPFLFLWRQEKKKIYAQSTSETQREALVFELEKLRRVGQDLQGKTRELQAKDLELRLASQRLAEVERAKAEFVSVTSHQLRTPLSGIKWAVNMILQGQLGPVTPDQKHFLERSSESVDRLIIMVSDLLRLDVLEGDKGEYHFTRVRLDELLNKAIFEFSDRLKSKQLNLNFVRTPPPLPEIEADPTRLSMVIENILDNAVKYTPPQGNITVEILTERVNSARSMVEVVIADNGIGIPVDEQDKIFKRFYRGSNAIKVVPDGTGLGLVIAKAIVSRHGGEIWFQSKAGEGASFHFTIPLRQNKI